MKLANVGLLLLTSWMSMSSTFAGSFGIPGLADYFGNGITSTTSGSKQPLDIGITVSGAIVDPRTRTWNLSSSDVPACTQSGTWNVGLSSGSNLVGKVGIDQTTPGTTNGVQVNAALPVGTNSIGQITANAGTNLNTSALALSANQTNGSQKTQTVDASGNVQPSGDVATRKIFMAITDGTNTQAVKAASTAAASTDPGAVVVLSSNFPVLTGTTGTAVSVGNTSTATVASNANRAGLILVNTSIQRESCTVGTAVLNSGVTLFPGGTWTMDQYTFTTAAINCIAGAASSNISVQEFTK